MSRGLMPVRFPPAPDRTAKPSITYRGSLLPINDDPPRMRSEIVPSEAWKITNPGTFAASIRSIGSTGVRSNSSELTTALPLGLRPLLGLTNELFPEAHPETKPIMRPQETTKRGWYNMFAPGTSRRNYNKWLHDLCPPKPTDVVDWSSLTAAVLAPGV